MPSKSTIGRRYGWRPDVPDRRDHFYEPEDLVKLRAVGKPLELPSSVDLRDKCPAVYDQGALGSCTANALGFAFQFDEMIQHNTDAFQPSRLFIYYNERDIEGTVSSDSGAEIRDGMKSLGKTGVCPETEWEYDISKFTQKPSDICYKDAHKHVAVRYRRVRQDLEDMKHCLAAGRPIVFGFAVYESFESAEVAKTGMMPMPDPTEEVLGGHAVSIVGYNDDTQHFLVRNSWGEAWGEKGYFWMPYDFAIDPYMCQDFWAINTVSNPARDAAKLKLLQPTAGEVVPAGSALSISWKTVGSTAPENSDGAPPVYPAKVSLYWAVNSFWGQFQRWQPIAEKIDNTGSYEWIVPEEMAVDTRYYVRVCSADDGKYLFIDSSCFGVSKK